MCLDDVVCMFIVGLIGLYEEYRDFYVIVYVLYLRLCVFAERLPSSRYAARFSIDLEVLLNLD